MQDHIRIAHLFRGLSSAYGTHGEPYQEPNKLKWEIKKTAKTIREAVTEELWKQHLSGKRPLGIISITETNICYWGSIDVDVYDQDLFEIVAKVEKAKYPLLPCRSKSGGLHLFLFLKDGAPASAVQTILREMAASLGLSGSEIFPKQSQILMDRGDLGSWMVMPYFGGTYGGKLKEQVGLKRNGAEMTLTEFCRTAEGLALDTNKFAALGHRKKQRGNGKPQIGNFKDGPPCLEHLAESGFPDGTRNNALFHMGVYYRRKNPGDWKTALTMANHEFMKPPVSDEELAGVIRSLDRKNYEYTCKAEPMCSHCDSSLCRTRKFGIGEEGNLPIISSLSKLDTRPTVWFVTVMDKRLEVPTEVLQSYWLFQRELIEVASTSFGHIKQAVWTQMLMDAMEDMTLIEAPEDLGLEGRFHEYLEEYLTNRLRGERVEDLLRGHPWEDEENHRHYFRLMHLVKFLDRENVRDENGKRIGRTTVARFIQNMGGGHDKIFVKNKQLRVWWVPSFQKESDMDVPPVPGAPI